MTQKVQITLNNNDELVWLYRLYSIFRVIEWEGQAAIKSYGLFCLENILSEPPCTLITTCGRYWECVWLKIKAILKKEFQKSNRCLKVCETMLHGTNRMPSERLGIIGPHVDTVEDRLQVLPEWCILSLILLVFLNKNVVLHSKFQMH